MAVGCAEVSDARIRLLWVLRVISQTAQTKTPQGL
jgi:hypothetical protein